MPQRTLQHSRDSTITARPKLRMPYKSALLVLALAVIPLLYVNSWLGITAGIAAYAIAARLANRDMDRVFPIEKLKAKAGP